MTEPTEPKRGDEPDEQTEGGLTEGLKPWIAVSLAAIVLLGAGLAVLQTDASVKESNTARETTRTAVGALRANVVERTVEGLEDDLAGERSALAFRRTFLRGDGSLLLAAAGEQRSERSRDRALAGARAQLPEKRTEQALRQLKLETARNTLKQAALAETRITWNTRSTQYTTVIAVLAVALFLVGFALVLGGPVRRAFFGLGLALAVFCLAWAAWVLALGIPGTSDDVIAATARGQVLTEEGLSSQAVASLNDAVDADGDYADAYSARAVAGILAANPDFATTGAITDVGGEATRAAIEDAQAALDLEGDRDILTVVVIALVAFYAGEYDTSIEAADDATAINAQVPDVFAIRSASELGRGDEEAANASLEEGLGLLDGTEPTPRDRQLASDYINYMEWLIAREPDAARAARAFEERLVRIETGFSLDRDVSGKAPARGSATVRDLRVEDGRLKLRIVWRDLPEGTALSAIGFERPLRDGAWVQPPELALFREASGSGGQAASVALERNCEPTEVRVDVYLDGERVDSTTGPGVAPTCP